LLKHHFWFRHGGVTLDEFIESLRFLPPSDFRAGLVDVGGTSLLVMEWPEGEPPRSLESSRLTAAERDVLSLLLQGRSNAAIASHRATSERTIANQVASIFKKTGVRSRAELFAQVTQGPCEELGAGGARARRRSGEVMFDPIRFIDACHALWPETEWALRILEALEPFDCGLGLMAFSVNHGVDGSGQWRPVAAIPSSSPGWRVFAAEVPNELVSLCSAASSAILSARRAVNRLPCASAALERALAAFGAVDALILWSLERGGQGVFICAPYERQRAPSAPEFNRLARLVWHLEAGVRLRRWIASAPSRDSHARPQEEYHLSRARAPRPNVAQGKLALAVRGESLAQHCLRWLREALSYWREFLDGGWSLLDQGGSDGCRVLLAVRVPSGSRDPRAMTTRESAALALAARGFSNKEIAFEMGLAPSTVAGFLKASQDKLGVPSRRALIAMWSRVGNLLPHRSSSFAPADVRKDSAALAKSVEILRFPRTPERPQQEAEAVSQRPPVFASRCRRRRGGE
jgi:DNA-binding NarL/FixJ family response regulator